MGPRGSRHSSNLFLWLAPSCPYSAGSYSQWWLYNIGGLVAKCSHPHSNSCTLGNCCFWVFVTSSRKVKHYCAKNALKLNIGQYYQIKDSKINLFVSIYIQFILWAKIVFSRSRILNISVRKWSLIKQLASSHQWGWPSALCITATASSWRWLWSQIVLWVQERSAN